MLREEEGAAEVRLAYAAPESFRGKPSDKSDQYSLAILTYFMLTGSLPFKGEMPYQLMHSHLHEQPTPLLHWRHDLPGNLMPVLERGLSKDPTQRYANVEFFAAALDQDRFLGQVKAQRGDGWRRVPIGRHPAPNPPQHLCGFRSTRRRSTRSWWV